MVMWKYVTPVASAAVVLLGISVLLGWVFDLSLLKSALPKLPVMVPNTAVCLILSGIALGWIGNEQSPTPLRRIGQVCALLAALIGLLTLIEYLSRHSLGLDLLLVRSASAFPGDSFPGRPSPQTAITLCLFGCALLLLSATSKTGSLAAQLLAIATALVSLTAIMGYLYNVHLFYGIPGAKGMAAHTALACLALSLGILCARPDQAIMAVVTGDSAGGVMARRLLPAVILFPLLLGWLRLLGEQNRLYDTPAGASLMVLMTITLLAGIILSNAARLHALDVKRQEAVEALQQTNESLEARVRDRIADLNAQREWLRITLTSIGDAVIATDMQGQVTFMNPVAETMTGWTQAEAKGRDLGEVFVIRNEETRQPVESPVEKVLREGAVVGLANHTILLGRDGAETPIDDTGAPIRDEKDDLLGVVLVFHDTRERRQAEQALRESETLYRTLGEAVPNFVWTFGMDGKSHFVNQRWTDYTGLTLEQAQEVPANVLHHPEDYPQLVKIWTAARVKGEAYEAEFRFRRFDGVYRWFIARAVPLKDENGRILQWIGTTTDIHERKMAEQALRESVAQYRQAMEERAYVMSAARCLLWHADIYESGHPLYLHWDIHFDNEAAQRFLPLALEPGEAYKDGFYRWRLLEDRDACNRLGTESVRAGRSYEQDFRCRGSDGSIRWLHEDVHLETVEAGKQWKAVGVCTDITERKQLEMQLLQAQKLESIGRLAGGVAHDFNNLLSVVVGHAELAEQERESADSVLEHIRIIQQAGERAANLTRQLLAFARKQMIAPQVISLNDLARDMDRLLRRLIGENIELVTLLHPALGRVNVDPGQFEQILVNLAVNARDAMPEGGKLTIETANVSLDEEYAHQHPPVVPGAYILLSVSDTGVGMEEGVKGHIFEPFFTTKELGKGTGLGLATVYGIVKQSGGYIWVYSEPGQGTTFKIYLPCVDEAAAAQPSREEAGNRPHGIETILVVEDEPILLSLASAALQKQGYTVLQAANGEQALRIAEEYTGTLHLLVTDVIMPQMGGKELAERLRTVRPDVKVLFTSGYTDDAIVHHGVLEADMAFLQKPFTPTTLARKVREVLETSPPNPPLLEKERENLTPALSEAEREK